MVEERLLGLGHHVCNHENITSEGCRRHSNFYPDRGSIEPHPAAGEPQSGQKLERRLQTSKSISSVLH